MSDVSDEVLAIGLNVIEPMGFVEKQQVVAMPADRGKVDESAASASWRSTPSFSAGAWIRGAL